jgi:hypothetical protein
MASTYTANSGIEKPGSGEQSGTWGDTTNTNFDIIDRALNGVGAITLSGTTHTLTTSDGSLSDGQFKVLVLGGSPSGTNTITITPNDQDKMYLVKNGSGQTATFTQGSGGNVSILNGDFAWIFADGAGSGAAVTLMTANTDQITNGAVTSAKITDGTIATADIADSAITSAKIADGTIATADIADDAATSAKVAIDVQTKSGTASVTMTATAVQTFIKHSGTGTLSIGAGQYDGQTVNIGSVGTMTLSWHGSSKGVSLGNQAKLASGVYDSSAGYWFFSETVTS